MLVTDDSCTLDDIRAIKHARRLVSSGHIDMASRAASTDHRALDCNDAAVLQQLRQLHPAASDVPMPALPFDAHTPLVRNDAALVRLIRASNNGKAGGPSGWNGAMLAILADSPTCMQGLRSIISDITTGRIPPSVRSHITATRLVALAKPNGAPRPIAMGELFYRVAAVRAVREAAQQRERVKQQYLQQQMQCSTTHLTTPHSTPHAAQKRPSGQLSAPACRANRKRRRDRQLDNTCVTDLSI